MIAALALAFLVAAPPPALPALPALPTQGAAASGPRLAGEWPAAPSGKRVSLNDGRITVDRALRKVADAAGWNLVANTGRAGDRLLVISLKDVPVEDALGAVLEGTPLTATRRGDTVTVAPSTAPAVEVRTLTGFDVPGGKKVTASFSDAPVDKALRQIADAAGWSIVLPPGLRGAVNASFRNTPAEEALKAVLSQSGLVAAREGSVVTVAREVGPRMVVRGGKRITVFDRDGEVVTEEVRGPAEDSTRSAEEMLQTLRGDATEDGGKGRDKVLTGNVTIGPGERWNEVVAIRGNVQMETGSHARQVTAILGDVEIGPGVTVEREVVAIGGDVHVSPGARIGKDAVSVGGEVSIDQGAVVEGQEVSVSVPGIMGLVDLVTTSKSVSKPVSLLLRFGKALAKFAVFFLLGLLVLAIAPARLDRVTTSLSCTPVRDVLIGALGTLAMPVLTVLLVVTVVGILLVPVQLVAILVAGILGYTALALLVGRALPIRPEKGTAVVQLAVGSALVVLLTEIPFVGVMAMVTAWFLVFGAVLRTRGGQEPSVKPPPVPPVAPTMTITPVQGP